MRPAVAYYRISKKRKGKATYGLKAQRTAVHEFLISRDFNLVKEFSENETGGKNDRKILKQALDYCRRYKAILLIAKLDRLGRRVSLISTLLESSVHFRVVAYPDIDPKQNHLFFLLLAVAAEVELMQIRERTKAGLAEAKRNGVLLGSNGRNFLSKQNKKAADDFALSMKPIIESINERGIKSVRGIARELNKKRIKTFHGNGGGKKRKWHPKTVFALLNRIKIIDH